MSRVVANHRHGIIDYANSTSTPLAGGGTFTGEWTDITEYGIAYVSVYSDVASATDGVIIEQSIDGVNAYFSDEYTLPASRGKNYAINCHGNYIRLRFTNGVSAQTIFEYALKLNTTGLPSSHRIQDEIISDDDAQLVKAVLTGIDPTGHFINFQATSLGNFKVAIQEYGDTSSIDAFARLRISQPFTLYDSKQLHDKQPLFWDEIIAGSSSSTHIAADAKVQMSVTASASDYVIRQTKQRFNYQPGKSQLVIMTLKATQETGITKQVGAFDGTGGTYRTPRNGIFFQVDESDISWNICKNGTTTETVVQADWNYDKLDGTGPSGETLDLNALEIIFFDIEWLGAGRVRVGTFIKGIPRYVHFFYHANNPSFSAVYMSTPNLALRYYIESDGTGSGSLDHICSTVISEGGIQETGILRSVNTGTTHLDADAADQKYAILGIKIQSTYYDITVYPEYFSMISETNDDFKWTIELNPTVSGTFTYSAVTSSAVEYAQGATANTITASGIVIDSGFSKSSATIDRQIKTALRMGSTIAGVADALVLTVTPLSSNADIQASLTYRELL